MLIILIINILYIINYKSMITRVLHMCTIHNYIQWTYTSIHTLGGVNYYMHVRAYTLSIGHTELLILHVHTFNMFYQIEFIIRDHI